jgi:hypothetical protein
VTEVASFVICLGGVRIVCHIRPVQEHAFERVLG